MNNNNCSISTCNRTAKTKGWCKFHYDRQLRGRDLYAPLQVHRKDCSEPGCPDSHYCKGFCKRHYQASKYASRPRPTSEQLFWEKVDKHGPTAPHMDTACWLFTAKSESNGYGVVSVQGKNQTAHRAAWFFTHGKWPTFLLHACDVRSCVNPNHLREGDHQANAQDRVERDRSAKGSTHGRSRLSETDIPLIDTLYWEFSFTDVRIAELFRVSRGTIQHAIQRRNWRHIPSKYMTPQASGVSARVPTSPVGVTL